MSMIRRMHAWLQIGRLALRQRRGAIAVEMAIVAPILALCLISVYDLGNALQQHIRLREAVRAGGLFAQTYPDDLSGIQSAVTSAVSDWNNVSVSTPNRYCECWNLANNTFSSTNSCNSECSSGTQLGFVSVSASRPFSAMFLTGITTILARHEVRYQ